MARISSLLGISAHEVTPATSFFQQGVESLTALKLVTSLSQWLGKPLPPTLLWEYPTLEELVAHLSRGEGPVARSAPRPLEPGADEPMALVGLACRFPSAPDARAFWSVLEAGADCVTPPPRAREGLHLEGAFLADVEHFDADFFGISPREAGQMDPQQRLLLELSWEALEDAGLSPRTLRGSRTGVFTGLVWRDYADLQSLQGASPLLHTCTGHAGSIAANRVSYFLGLEGPSLAIDTACSSSLVALHEACRSLRAGESTLALVGGVQLNLSPRTYSAVSAFGALAPDGRCKTFDARANGYGRGEGAGVVVLKPLSRALVDGDSIYCLIRGSAVNNDGASNGLTAPSPKAQERLLRDAYASAGIDPSQVQYVELHGTGTPLGDPIEARALGAVLGDSRAPERPLRVGSVKTNIGHLEAAAGVAGLIKVALAIRHQRLPPSIHFEQPNPHIPFKALRLEMQTGLTSWPRPESPALAGISSFGFGGTNCHVIVEEHRLPPRPEVVRAPRPERAEPPKVAFVFAGAGAAWWGMGRELMGTEPVFRARFEACDAVFQPLGGWSLVEALFAPRARAGFERGEVQLPLVLAFQLSLVALWRERGIEPDAVVGYSVGEWAAAHVAGILSLEEVFALAHHYIQVQRGVSGDVGMGVVGLPANDVSERLGSFAGRIAIASENSPVSTGLGGERAALQEFTARLAAEEVFARTVEIDFCAHIPQVEPLQQRFVDACPELKPLPGRIPMMSTVTGGFVDGLSLGPSYWADNFRQPVRFASAVKALLESGHEVFLDVNPHPLHARSIEENLGDLRGRVEVIASLRRGEPSSDTLHRALTALVERGCGARAPGASDEGPAELFVLSAKTEPALLEQARRTAGWLREEHGASLSDVCLTSGLRRDHHEHRLSLVASSRRALAEGLEAFARKEPLGLPWGQGTIRPGEARPVGFVFSGQGSFPLGESARLWNEEPCFRASFERCEKAFRAETGASLLPLLQAERVGSGPPRTEVEQPLLFAFQVSLAALWSEWGIRPDAVVGHSVGEVTAAHVAGALSLDEAMALVVARGRLMGRIAGRGAMATVSASVEVLEPLIAAHGGSLEIAGVNGPVDVVVSGTHASLESLRDSLQQRGLRVRLLNVDYAFHCAQLDEHLDALDDCTRTLRPKALSIPLYSTVSGGRISGMELGAAHWRANIRRRVLFSPAVRAMLVDGVRTFVELAPHPVLSQPLSRTLESSGIEGTTGLFSTRRDRPPRTTLLAALGTLHTLGREPAWKGLFPQGGRRAALPTYAWQRERHWFDAARSRRMLDRRADTPAGEVVFESRLRAGDEGLLGDHRLYGTVVVAGAFMVGMVLDAARELWGAAACSVRDVSFLSSIVLADSEERVFQVAITAGGDFRVSTRLAREDSDWSLHAEGRLVREEASTTSSTSEDASVIEARLQAVASIERFHEGIAQQGLGLGPRFRWLEALFHGEREAFGRLRPPQPGDDVGAYRLHPGLLDSCFQVLGAVAGFASIEGLAFVPMGIQHFALHGEGLPRFCHLVLRSGSGAADETSKVDLRMFDVSGGLVAEVTGLAIRRAPREVILRRDGARPTLSLRVEWRAQPLAPATSPTSWVILADQGGWAARLARELVSQGGRAEVLGPDAVATGLGARLDALAPAALGVADLRGLDVSAPLDLLQRGTELVRLLVSRGESRPPRLVVVTRGAQATGAEAKDAPLSPELATVWGLGHVVALEHPELRCVRVDLDPTEGSEDLARLAAELLSPGEEDRIAFRAGARLVARLARTRLPSGVAPVRFSESATYLVTGGWGGLGLEVARWMVDRGARHVLLMGRSEPGLAALERIESLRATGAQVVIARGDVAEGEDVARVLETCRASMPPLRGVVHAAGVLDDGLLTHQSRERMARVLAPKVQGALNLHLETLSSPLDFFVFFSSISAVMGSAGQVGYAAANAYLDTLAHQRRARGLKATSINWGPWAEVGMAARLPEEAGKSWSTFGLGMLTPESGLAALDAILGADTPQLIVAATGRGAVRESLPPFFEVLGARRVAPVGATPAAGGLVDGTTREGRARLLALVQRKTAEVLGLAPGSPIDPRRPLQALGLDSLMSMQLRTGLASLLGRPLPMTLLFDHPTLEQLLAFLERELGPVADVAPAPASEPVKVRRAVNAGVEPIAVVGMSCRLPGGVRGPEDYWRLLSQGIHAVSEVPASRWDVSSWYDADPEAPGKTYSKHGGFLDEVDTFDASFFGISRTEARSMDPQQRMLLELSWEALESGGLSVERLKGSATGVFLGICLSDYALLELNAQDPRGITAYSGTGSVLSVAAGRLAYALGLEGPSFAVDTACSSSLVATHLACQSLREGECELALVGGSNLLLSPRMSVYFSKLKSLAPDGVCRAFDGAAKGYARGEGAGVVVLKRLSDALAEGTPILGVIRGSAVNQGGRSNGLTAPSRPAQERVIQRALQQGGVAPLEVGYVEAHGTGTSLGDSIEVEALSTVLGSGRPRTAPLRIGSVKTNIGHLEGAAGIASLIKALLVLRHRELPRSLHFQDPSPYIPWSELPIEVVTEHREWQVPEGGRRIAGVSAFGFGGTNAHIVLEEAPLTPRRDDVPVAEERAELLVLSARAPESLRESVERFHAMLVDEARGSGAALRDLCYSAGCRRTHHEHRLAVVAGSRSGAAESLAAFLRGAAHPAARAGYAQPGAEPRVVFLFTGLEGPWAGAGRALLDEEPVFRDALRSVDAVLTRLAGWSVIDQLRREQPRFDLAHIAQPACVALQLAFVALLRSWGVEPDAVLGSCTGEVAAAHAAGVLSLEDAMRIAIARGGILGAVASGGVEEPLEEMKWALREVRPEPAAVPFYSSVSGTRAKPGDFDAEHWARGLWQPVQLESAISALAEDGYTFFVEIGPDAVLAHSVQECFQRLGTARATVLSAPLRGESERHALLSLLGALYVAGVSPDWTRVFPSGGEWVPLPSYPWRKERHWVSLPESAPEPKASDEPPPLRELARMAPEQRRGHVEPFLRREVVKLLDCPGDLPDARQPLVRLGFDSLMGMKLKARVELSLGLTVSAVKLLSGLSLDELVKVVLENIDALPPLPETAAGDSMEEFRF
ncbi:type I polyketide synthase [Myxococcus landrumensis]|uniref:SDR family NAD(P)-dependent oxidoreductase n=1 Tax=Myxococcus landrumensis TaxID=2813577 RepID=A0ABX7N7X0_9BACT|nr:type I polyketide synthase [Myxococcus landrumus]QSQ14847.1 SDR family NAD(P)-dependent oxidoreductase [Myxococcus landrumus]